MTLPLNNLLVTDVTILGQFIYKMPHWLKFVGDFKKMVPMEKYFHIWPLLQTLLDALSKQYCELGLELFVWESSPHLPVIVFQNPTGASQYIDDFHVTHMLQSLAKTIYNITNSNDLARFTTHSLRVSAYVLLHETGQTPNFIKAWL